MEQHEVVITDARARWMIKEDQKAFCQLKCKFFKKCSTRAGCDCKHHGGSIIPKIRG